MRCQPTAPSERLFRPSRRCSRCMASQNRPRIAVAGCAASRWYPDTPENHLPWPLHRHVSDHLPCSKQSRFFRRVLSILPPRPLSATAHLQPLAQPTALRHPGSRCDIDSHPDCRPFLTLIVAPHSHSLPKADWSGSHTDTDLNAVRIPSSSVAIQVAWYVPTTVGVPLSWFPIALFREASRLQVGTLECHYPPWLMGDDPRSVHSRPDRSRDFRSRTPGPCPPAAEYHRQS